MEHATFSRPLEISGTVIADADQAADYLLAHWPIDRGESYDLAKLACLEAIAGECSADDAKAAFLRAAEEAGVMVLK